MSGFVVDASVAIKWFLAEEHSQEADALLAGGEALHAPDLLLAECGNILWKRVNRGELTTNRAFAILDALQESPLAIKPATPLLTEAFAIANRYQRSFYDSLYLALAESMDAPLVTADLRLFNALQDTRLARHIRWVGSISP